MGHIRKEELHESLINELEELGNIDLSGKQDKTDESLLTESKDLVGAINELFQSANNGKELIASAIGEPLNAEDTFSAMSSDINGLLSTFKTNMMNNGITVESGDKFKSLIDKIATMAGEGGTKGIKFAEGDCNLVSDRRYVGQLASKNQTGLITSTVITNLDFTPTYIFLLAPGGIIGYYDNIMAKNYGSNALMSNIARCVHNSDSRSYMSIENITSQSFEFHACTIYTGSYFYSLTATFTKWFAIGVGEEDTTLRDSLASILQEEGIDVTEEDDMASLISKVDEEFDRQVIPQGNAGPEHVLQGVSFMNSTGNVQNGNIPILSSNYGTEQHYMTGEIQVGDYSGAGGQCLYFKIPRYWYTNVDWVMSYVPDLLPKNIVSGKSICGITGTATVSNLGGCSVVAGNTFTLANKQLSDSSSFSTSETSYTISSIPQGTVRVNINIKTAGTVQKGPICNFYHNGQLIAGNITGRRGYTYDQDFDIQIKNGDVFKIDMTPRTTATNNYCEMTIYFSLS